MYALAAQHTAHGPAHTAHGKRPCTLPGTRNSLSLLLTLTRAGHQEAASRQSVTGVRNAKSPPPPPPATEAKGSGASAQDQLGAATVASGGRGNKGSKDRQSKRLLNVNRIGEAAMGDAVLPSAELQVPKP